MSWFQSLRDDFSLRPLGLQHTHSDNAAMASGSPDVMPSQEPAEVAEECQGKKRSKFQTFKKFFTRKKRKDQSAAGAEAGLKASQSSDNVSKTSENNTLTRSEGDKGSGSKMNLGGKAKSHDSVFVSDSSDANEALGASQDSIHGKVKSLQLQLKQAIRLGSPPSLMCVKRTEDAGTMSEDDGLPSSPPEYTSMNKAQRGSSNSLEGEDSDDDQLSCAASSRAVSPLVVPGDFSQPASPFGCLDNSAAKHKLGLRYKACNKRKPLSRIDLKAKVDSLGEKGLDTSVTDVLEEKEQNKTTEIVGADDLLTPSLEREENGEEEMEGDEEEQEQPQHSREPLLTNKEEREEEEDEFEGDPDVPQRSDTLSPPQLCLSEGDVPDAQPSSKPSSRASTPNSPSTSPEPIDCPKEYLLDPPGVAYGEDTNRIESDLGEESGEEENEVQETREEESSFLQEVLSSLKTPLVSSSLGIETETVIQEIKEEVKEKKRDDVASEEEEEDRVEETVDVPAIYQAAPIDSPQKTGEEEVRVEETVDEPAIYQAAPADSPQKTGEEEEIASLCMSQDVDEEEEEAVKDNEEERSHEKEEPAVEQLGEHCQKEEEDKGTEEVQTEDQNFTGNDVSQVEEEETGVESEGEEEVMELQKEAEAEEEEVQERREEDDAQLEEAHERVEELEEAIEEERDGAKEMMEVLPDAAAEEVQDALTVQEVDEGADVVAGDEAVSNVQHDDDDENPPDMDDQVSAAIPESQEIASQSYGEEMEREEEEVENVIEPDLMEQKVDQEEDKEAKQSDGDQTEDHEEQGGVETSRSDMKQDERDHTETTENAFPRPSSLSFPESYHESQIQESGTITPSKTSTTTLHINLLSPSSDKATSFFQQSPTATHPKQSEIPSQQALAVTDQDTGSTEDEPAEIIETVEQEKSALEEVGTPPICVEEIVNQPSTCPDQSKVRFTIAPAWQRSISLDDCNERLTPPSSPPTGVSSSSSTCMGPRGEDATSTTKEYPELKAEPASPSKVELVLSSGRGRNAGSGIAKLQSNATSPPSHESGVMVEGNPDSLFGVRLRKTSVLRRFSVEEEIPEPPSKPQVHPTSSKTDSPQPISGSPVVNQPSSNKPVLPKKPETLYGEASGRTKQAAAASGVPGRSDSPSWISVAKQKQKIYKENSLEEVPVNKEEQERKSSLPTYVGSAVSREPSIKTGSLLGISKPSVSVEKETRRSLSSPATAPSQLPKSQVVPGTVAPKPQVPPATSKHPLQTNPPQRCLSPPTPVPLAQKSSPCTSPPSLPKCSTSPLTPEPQSTTVTSSPAPISSRTTLEKTSTRAPGVSSQTPSSQRGQSTQALAQDEPPWMALAKKKAKAWSEMPQIVQ